MSVRSQQSKGHTAMQTVVDWTTRKRSSEKESAGSSSTALSPTEASETVEEEPFAFVKKARRCRQACCTAVTGSSFIDPNQEYLTLESTCIIFLPPPCVQSWFSGLTAMPTTTASIYQKRDSGGESSESDNDEAESEDDGDEPASRRSTGSKSNKEKEQEADEDDDDDDPFMEKATTSVQAVVGAKGVKEASPVEFPQETLGILAHEIEIDDCLSCANGGYQHFRLTVTLPKRGMQGTAVVERTGGDMLVLESLETTATTATSTPNDSPSGALPASSTSALPSSSSSSLSSSSPSSPPSSSPSPCFRFTATRSLGDVSQICFKILGKLLLTLLCRSICATGCGSPAHPALLSFRGHAHRTGQQGQRCRQGRGRRRGLK